jgi:hypothetical protein
MINEDNRVASSCAGGSSVRAPSPSSSETPAVAGDCTDVSVRGKWIKVPALRVNGDVITIAGKWIRVAAVHDEEWLETELADPELCVRKLKQSPVARADIFTFTQKIPATVPKYDYPLELCSVAVAHIPSFKAWWEALPQETRKNVRRSQKRGVLVRIQAFDDALVRGIAEVQNESPVRQGRRYPHYGKTFEQVKKDHSGFIDRSVFICAYYGEELIGFLKLVYRGEVASILQLNSKVAHYDKRPSNALLAKAVELCESRGASYLTYARFNYGNKSDSSLREFKIRNGFSDTLVPRFYIPLTAWGEFCVRTKLYRGLLGILPRTVITTLVAMRARWYDRKMLTSRCSSMPERPNRNRQMECSNPPAGSDS